MWRTRDHCTNDPSTAAEAVRLCRWGDRDGDRDGDRWKRRHCWKVRHSRLHAYLHYSQQCVVARVLGCVGIIV